MSYQIARLLNYRRLLILSEAERHFCCFRPL